MQQSFVQKYLCFVPVAVVLLLTMPACKKQKQVNPDFEVLQVFGGIYEPETVVLNYSGKDLPSYSLGYNVNSYSSMGAGSRLYIDQPATVFTLHAFPDTMPGHKPAFAMNLDLQYGETYSFFVSGPKENLDTMFFHESIIPVPAITDSSCYLRVVNFIRNTTVKLIITSLQDLVVADNLTYKNITGFIKIPIPSNMQDMHIEVREAGTNELLAEFFQPLKDPGAIDKWTFKARQIFLTGIKGGIGGAKPQIRQAVFN